MENSFFEYRNETADKLSSDCEDIIDNSGMIDESFTLMKKPPPTAQKNRIVFVPESEDSESGDATESYDEEDVQNTSKSVTRRSGVALTHMTSSSEEDVSKRGSIMKQSENSSSKVVLSSSDEEEVSPEIVPRRRPPLRQRNSVNSKSSDSPIIRRVKRRMVLNDSETDNSIIIDNDKTKMICLKDTPAKIDNGVEFAENIEPKNMSFNDSNVVDSNDDESVDDEEFGPDEDEMVMCKATRMSIMGIRPKDAESDDSDFIVSDESNLKSRSSNSVTGSVSSLNDLPDAGVSVYKPSQNTTEPPDELNNDDLDDSKLSCSTFGSPVKDDDITKHITNENNIAKNTTKEIDIAKRTTNGNNITRRITNTRSVLKAVNDSIDLTIDHDYSALKRDSMILKPQDSNRFEAEDDEVTIIDIKPEVIALSSDEDESNLKSRSSNSVTGSVSSLNDLPDAGVSVYKPSQNTTEPPDELNNDELDDSKLSCSTFGSPVKDDDITKHITNENNIAKNTTKEIDIAKRTTNGNNITRRITNTRSVSKAVNDSIDLTIDHDYSALKRDSMILKPQDSNRFEAEDDEVTIIDIKPEVIALSSDEDESNLKSRSSNSVTGSVSSLNDLPDAGVSVYKPSQNTTEPPDELNNDELDDSKLSCSTFGSPVKDDDITKHITNENNIAKNTTKEIDIAKHTTNGNNITRRITNTRSVLKAVNDSIDLTIDHDYSALKRDSMILKPQDSNRFEAEDDEVTIIDIKPEVIALSSDEDEYLIENMDVDTLPDGGVKLLQRLSGLETEVKRQGDKVANMVVEPTQPTAKDVANDGFKTGLTWDEISKKALSTHMAERNLIVERLRNLHESLDSRPPEEEHAAPPKAMKSELMGHQLHALSWLKWRETQHPCGGILADDMGLGKTVTMIALILSSKENNLDEEDDDDDVSTGKENSQLVRGGTLVVCPASLIQQWSNEVTKHCRSHALSVCLHHGATRATQPRRLATYELVVTTYNLLQRDSEKNGVLTRIRWTRIILDEAHIIRNHKAATSTAVSALKGQRRWCLTGTPVQNKDLEVFALLKFLRCTPFDDLAMWKKWIDNKSLGGQDRLSTIMRCLLLRRTKQQLQERGQLNCLPERSLHQLTVTLTEEEMNVYQKVLVFSKTLFAQFLHQRAAKQDMLAGGAFLPKAPGKDDAYAKMHKKTVALQGAKPVKSHEILVLLLRLRQVCCHCGLIAAMLDDSEDVGDVTEDPGSVDLLQELHKLSLEDDKRKSNIAEEEEEEARQEGTTVAEAIRSVLSPNNPVFDLKRQSSKIEAVMDCLRQNVFKNKGDKAVVVSQWTTVLHLVEVELNKSGVRSVTLSGKVPITSRPPLIAALNDPSSNVRVMLLSLCAGGVGLNLCGANHLLLLDPHWNPQLEEQAQDRIYRVGQTKPVHIYRYMCLDTVEASIRSLQQTKLQVADSVLTGARHTNASKLSIEDLKMLFNMGPLAPEPAE